MLFLTRYPILALLVLLSVPGLTQADSITERLIPQIRDDLEAALENQDEGLPPDFLQWIDERSQYLETPLNLNEATESEIRNTHLFSERQVFDLLNYRKAAGPLISLYELQAIPSFDLATIRQILPFITIRDRFDDYRVSFRQMLAGNKRTLYLRWRRTLQRQRGYMANGTTRYEGSPDQFFLRYTHRYANRLSLGLTAEKDSGETFFSGSNPQGFDHYSVHFFLRDYTRKLKAVALGDYRVNLGQGLILHSGFGYGKSVSGQSARRSGRTLAPYSSVNEARFMRGAAATVALGNRWEATAFLSHRRRDGNLLTAGRDGKPAISSLDEDGYHRTHSEIEDEKVARQWSTGSSLRYQRRQGHLAVNTLFHHLDKPLERRSQPYNQFYFRGSRLFNASIDYSWIFKNFHFFGETALDKQGQIAGLHGLLIGLDPRVDLSLVYRRYPKDYVALNASPFAETDGGRNEFGFFTSLTIRPHPRWTFSAYFDRWRHPWLRFNADAPSRGREYRARLTYHRKRQWRIYLEVKREVKEKNAPGNTSPIDRPISFHLFQGRLHLARQLTGALELRTRIDWGFARNATEGKQYGFVLLQDILFRPIDFPLSFTTRYALFDTDSYDIRFYHYENGLLHAYSIPAYYEEGSRFYLNLRYRPFRPLTLEARYARSFWPHRKTIGNGPEEIEGPVRTRIALQLRYQF